ncbi:MAG: hypothetical protein V3S00_02355 [Dehalococcoidia bacterium]
MPASTWRLPARWCWALLSLWWAGFGLYYYHQPALAPRWDVFLWFHWNLPNAALLQAYLLSGLAFVWLFVLGLGLGMWILSRSGLKFDNRYEAAGFALACGWGALGLAMLALGLLMLWHQRLVLTLLVLASVLLAGSHRRLRDFSWGRTEPPWDWIDGALLGALVLLAAAGFIGVFIPEIFYDGLVYHLALPEIFWRHHGIVAVPHNLYSGIPSLVEMLYALALPLGGTATAHMVHWGFGVGAAMMIVGLGRRFFGRRAGLLAALIFYCCPLVSILSWKAAIELGWTFFQFAALYALAVRCDRAVTRGRAADRAVTRGSAALRWTCLSGFLTGLTLGTKYPAWPLFGVSLALLGYHLLYKERTSLSAAWREISLWLGICLLTLALWPFKNALLYGNPIYPFWQEWFVPEGVGPKWREMVSAAGGGRGLAEIFGSWAGLRSYLLHPWRVLAAQSNDVGCLGPLFLLSLAPLVLLRSPNRAYSLLRAALLALWGIWSLSSGLVRFFIPQTALSAVLFGAALERLAPRGRRLAYAALAFVVCVNLFWTAAWFKTYQADSVVFGARTRSEYLSRAYPSYARSSFPALEFVNTTLPRSARVLFIGEARGFHCRRDYVAATLHDRNPLETWIRASRSPEELRERFARNRITHVLINPAELAVWQGSENRHLPLDPEQERLYSVFTEKYLRLLFEHKHGRPRDLGWTWSAVYEVL